MNQLTLVERMDLKLLVQAGGCIVTLCEKKNVFDIIENLKLSGAKDAFEVRVC